MTETPPIRPQRGMVRTNRETTGGLLMKVIRSVSSSWDLTARDRERRELEKGFALCDQKLNDLVSQHNNDLYQVMNIFSRILNNLGQSKERLLDTREKLQDCQKLLDCKRDELKKLWLESVENRSVYDLLEQVEQLASLPKQVDSFAAKKYYLHAAQCCVDGLRQLGEDTSYSVSSTTIGHSKGEGGTELQNNNLTKAKYTSPTVWSLSKIEALSEVRQELLAKKEFLFESSINELHRHLYTLSTAEIRNRYYRNGSFRSSDSNQLEMPNLRLRSKIDSNELANNKNSTQWTRQQSVPQEADHSSLSSFFTNYGTNVDNYPEEDSRQFLLMLTKCLGLLNKIPDAIEQIKERCDREFITVVIKTAQEVLSNVANTTLTSNASVSATRSNSFLDVSSMGSDSMSGTFTMTDSPQQQQNVLFLAHGVPMTNQVVLTCTSLIGHSYDGYSHLVSGGSSQLNTLQLPKSSIQLQDFFELLMRQYQTIVSLHNEIVLPSLKKLELGLHVFENTPTEMSGDEQSLANFYTHHDLWTKVQLLVQQLLDFYLENANLSSSHTSGGLGSSISHMLLPHPSSTGGNTLVGVSGSSTLPTDYSSYFLKRRVLAGAMNAMNVMTKNTMTAVAAASNSLNDGNTGLSNTSSTGQQSNTNINVSSVHSSVTSNISSSSTGNFLSSVVGSSSPRGPTVQLFKFDHSSQAISWNAFLAEQHQQQLISAKSNNDDESKKDSSKNEESSNDANHKLSSSNGPTGPSSATLFAKLFETLRIISLPSPDNLVVVYAPLMKFAQHCVVNENKKNLGGNKLIEITNQSTNNLQTYLSSVAEKFSAHINLQLEKMLESASKSLESGNTIQLTPLHSDNNGGGGGVMFEDVGNIGELSVNMNSGKMASQSLNADIAMTGQQMLKTKLYPPLLESAVMVDIATRDLLALMQAMPDYSNVFLGYICNVMNAFKSACIHAYEGIVEVVSGHSSSSHALNVGSMSVSSFDVSNSATGFNSEKRVISANWAKDPDISRLLKSLPNWTQLSFFDASDSGMAFSSKENNERNAKQKRSFQHQLSSFEESPEDIKLRNMRETEILAKNLSQDIPKNELLWQDGQLRQLALLHQSFEWMAARCDNLVSLIVAMQQESGSESNDAYRNMSEVYIATLNQLSKDFEDIAETCLLVMHLEVRIHCFYHLLALDYSFFNQQVNAQSSRNIQEHNSDDPTIIPLLDDLRRMYDELQRASLMPYKMTYVFEGLDYLLAAIFVNAVSQVRRIKPNGIKRACRAIYDIQRRLTGITKSRELGFDYARQYFELLLLTPEEILASIIERGPVFNYNEYRTAISLLHKSALSSATNSNLDEMNRHLERLNKILNNEAVI